MTVVKCPNKAQLYQTLCIKIWVDLRKVCQCCRKSYNSNDTLTRQLFHPVVVTHIFLLDFNSVMLCFAFVDVNRLIRMGKSSVVFFL